MKYTEDEAVSVKIRKTTRDELQKMKEQSGRSIKVLIDDAVELLKRYEAVQSDKASNIMYIAKALAYYDMMNK